MRDFEYKEIPFVKKYWFFLLCYICIDVVGIYIVNLVFGDSSPNEDLLSFIGIINNNIKIGWTIGLTVRDFGNLTIFWLLFFFASL